MNRENAGINLQILIVKRNPDSLDYNQFLNGDRYEIQECESTSEALEICQQVQTDCILVDWDSSELTGENFFQQLDKNLIPVVVVAENQNLTLPNYLVKATLTKELLTFAISQAIAQTALKRKLAAAEKELHDYRQSEMNFQAFLNNAPAIIYTKDLDGISFDVSDRKAAENSLKELNQELEQLVEQRTIALKASEADNRAILDTIPDLLLRLRHDGTCLAYIKPAIGAERFLPIENHISEVLPAELLQKQLQAIEQAIATGKLQIYEHQFLKQDRMFYEEVRILAINDLEVLVILRDISEQKLAETKLARSQAELNYHIDNSPLATIRWNRDFQVEYWSTQSERIFGWSANEVLGKYIYDCNLIFEDDLEQVQRVAEDLMKGIPQTCQNRNYHKDGSIIYCEWYNSVLMDQSGNLVSMLSLVQDVSDRKLAEESLKQSELKLRKLTENIPVILYQFLFKPDGSISFPFMSHGSYELYGLAPEVIEANGNAVFDLVCPEDVSALNHSIELSAQTLEPWQWEGRISISGQLKWISGISQPELLANGDILWHGMVRDISDRKKVEAFIELQNRFFRCLAIGDPLPSILYLLLRLIELEINHAVCGILVVNNQGRLSPITDLDLPNSLSLVFAGITINEAEATFGTNSLNLIDIATHPQWQNYQNSFQSQGLNTCWSIPINIRNGQQVLGFLNFYFSDHQIIIPTEFENTIIKFATYVIGIAIERDQAEIDLQIQLQKEQILSLRVQQELCDRQIAEEKLRHSQELLTLTIENTPVGICTFDLDIHFLSVNQNICQMFGYSAEEMLKQDILQLIHPDYREISMDGIQQLITGAKKSTRIEKQYIHQTGREIDAICRVRLIKDIHGKPLLFVASVEDITKQKQMKIALAQRMERQSFVMMISQQIRQSLNLDQVLKTAVNEVKRLLDSNQVAIIQLCPEGVTKIVKQQVDQAFASTANYKYLDLNFFTKWFKSFINGKTLTLNDVSEDVTFDEQTQIPSFQSKILAPIVQHVKTTEKNSKWQKNGNQLWGLLIVHSCGKFRQWQPEEAELIQHIANQLAIAIQQASLYEQVQNELLARQKFEQELQKQAAGDRLLSEITVVISQSKDIAQTLDISLEQIRQFMGADRTVVYKFAPSYHHDYKGIVIQEAVSRSELSIMGITIEDSCFATTAIGDQYRRGRVNILPDVLTSDLDPCYINLLRQFQVRANLVVPILYSSQLWGLLILHQCDRPRYWQPYEITFLQQIATQIGTVGQKEKLYLQLSSELSQKKVLLKEIHHRVKNNLQIMSSILYLQFRNTPPEIKLLSEEYQSRILSMSLIHDQLYRSDDLAHIDFHSYIQNLTTNLFQCYGTSQELIKLEIAVKNIFLPLDQSIPLGLIINELVSNALKYAFPKMHGKIKIQLVQSDPNIILTISDDGVGIPADFDLTTAEGLGMQLIQSLTEQLDGEFSFNGKNGLMVQITFPKI